MIWLAVNFKYLDASTKTSFVLSVIGVLILGVGLWYTMKQGHNITRVILLLVLVMLLVSVTLRASSYGLI